MDNPGARDDVAPWVAGSQTAWDLVHRSQGTAARRLRLPYLVRQQENDNDGGGANAGNGEPPAADAPPILTGAVPVSVDDGDAPEYGAVGAYRRRLALDGGFGFGVVPASGEAIAGLRETSAGEARQTECAVCLKDFEAEEKLRRMPCDHSFHERCIFDWLRVSGVCPLCRHRLPTDISGVEGCNLQDSINGGDDETEL